MRGSILASIVLGGVLFLSGSAFASNWYIAQTTYGTGDGSSCANAKQGVWPGSWDWGGVQPGDTVWLCGTINVSTTSQIIIGSSGNASTHVPVTVKFCSEGDCGAGNTGLVTAPNAGVMIKVANVHDVTIDGNGVGIIQCSDNGSSISGYTYHGNPTGIQVSGTTDRINIKDITFRNLYKHTYQVSTSDGVPGLEGGTAVTFQGTNNSSVYNCTILDAGIGITAMGSSTTSIHNNSISNTCMGINGGPSGGSTQDRLSVFNNDIEMGGNWMSSGGADCHINGIYFWADNTSSNMNNTQIYNNYVHGPMAYSTNFPVGSTWGGGTGFFHYDLGSGSGNIFFNNLVVGGPYMTPGPSNGFVSWANQETGAKIWNNTVVGPSGTQCFGGGSGAYNAAGNPDLRNNVCLNASRLYSGLYAPQYSDFNNIYGSANIGSLNGTDFATLSAWQAALSTSRSVTSSDATRDGVEYNSTTVAPNLDASYVPTGTPLQSAGQNLTSYCSAYPALCFDKPLLVGAGSGATTGNARPASGNWDNGPYQYQTTRTTIVPPGGPHVVK